MNDMAQKNLFKLAKGSVKTPEKEDVKPVLTPEEERDLKAKQKVKELLQDVPMTIAEKEELLEIESTPKKEGEWLEEQVNLLSEQVETLRNELAQSKEDYQKIFTEYQYVKNNDDSELKPIIIRLFNEIQDNHISMGRNFIIHPPSFLERLIMFFPFLAKEKRY